MSVLPSDNMINFAVENQCDTFYKLPTYIKEFIESAKAALGGEYQVRPFTINRSVTVFKDGKPCGGFCYDQIEHHSELIIDNLREVYGCE